MLKVYLGMILLLCFSLSIRATSAPPEKISLRLKDVSVEKFLEVVKDKAELNFVYNADLFKDVPKISVIAQNEDWASVLKRVLEPEGFTFDVDDGIVVFKQKKVAPKTSAPISPQLKTVRGTVYDENGETLIGVSVVSKQNSKNGVITDVDGEFEIFLPNINDALLFSYVGMEPKEVKLKDGMSDLSIRMHMSSAQELGDVIVEAGIMQRNKLGFTGSYTTVSQDELKAVGNMNVIQSLKSLDPSFVVFDNNLMGSDPNTMATIEVRGKTSMSLTSVRDDASATSNQPLFILDGFESSLSEINDLDMNRIESITILKDAGSTAIYGSKGGNGVIVIETIKPKQGELMISYNGSFEVSQADLSVYNLMNASEKLEFERLADKYGDVYGTSPNDSDVRRRNDYFSRLSKVQSGIDTYWLKVPIRTGFTQNHSLTISGGDRTFGYTVGASFRNVEGVMKESSRQSFGGNAKLVYRGLNNFNVANNTTINQTNAYNGSWGSFSNFAQANPYYAMRNADGSVPAELDSYTNQTGAYTAVNPLYNALLDSRSDAKTLTVTNNTNLDWYIKENLRVSGALSIRTSSSDNVAFTDPRNTKYQSVDYTKKGEYSSGKVNNWSYNANASINYNLLLKDAHNLTFFGRGAIEEQSAKNESFTAQGFPEGAAGIPSFAHSYTENSRPTYSETVYRGVSFVAAFNYNYKYRYLFDLNFNTDGSTTFGSNKKFQTFWSVGGGWNVQKEDFAKDWKWMQELKLRGTYGTNGNQNTSNVTSSVYSYYTGSNMFGTASYLSNFANRNLEWQVVKKLSTGFDFAAINNRLKVVFDVYQSKTDPMVVSLAQKLSTGISSYPVNMGYIKTKGAEFTVSYNVIHNLKERIILNVRVNGSTTNSTYGGYGNALARLNDEYKDQDTSPLSSMNLNSLLKYEDGRSTGDLWAVRSLGIDPATGTEIFLTKDGMPTKIYNANDRVVVGNADPDIYGIVGVSFTYKKLQANLNLRYSLGGYTMNTSLYNKVENIAYGAIMYNQDRRALYDRWQKPGDVTEFKGISLSTTTPISSRFIQRNNYLKGESGSIRWDFSGDKWIKTLGMKDLRVGVSMADLFTISSIKVEKGLDYPFAKAVTFDITCRF